MVKNTICLGKQDVCLSTSASGRSEKTIAFFTGLAWLSVALVIAIAIAKVVENYFKANVLPSKNSPLTIAQ